MTMQNLTEDWIQRARNAQREANKVLADSGHSKPRIFFLEEVRSKLNGAPIDIQMYFEESLICLRNDLNRPAIVVAWAGYFDVFCQALYDSKEADVRTIRTKWTFADASEFKEAAPEAQIIDVAKDVGFIRNPQRRMMDGWLSQRNQCAHPTVYRPSPNTAIGFVDSMIQGTLEYID